MDSILMCFYDQSQQRSVMQARHTQLIIDAVACSLVFPVTVVNAKRNNCRRSLKKNSRLQRASCAIA